MPSGVHLNLFLDISIYSPFHIIGMQPLPTLGTLSFLIVILFVELLELLSQCISVLVHFNLGSMQILAILELFGHLLNVLSQFIILLLLTFFLAY